MERKEALDELTNLITNFTCIIGKRLPDDVMVKLKALSEEETEPMAKMIYEAMVKNQEKAEELNRPSCQDTGLI